MDKNSILVSGYIITYDVNGIQVNGLEPDNDITVRFFTDIYNYKVEMHIDNIGANGIRIGLAALQNVKDLILPYNKDGEFLCNYTSVKIIDLISGKPLFLKTPKESQNKKEGGKYTDITDGLCLFNHPSNSNKMSYAISTKDAEINLINDASDYLIFNIIKREDGIRDLEALRKQLDNIYPYGKFSRKNTPCYGYFHTTKEV